MGRIDPLSRPEFVLYTGGHGRIKFAGSSALAL